MNEKEESTHPLDIFHTLILASVLSYNILSSFPSAVCVVAGEDYFYWLIKNNQPMRIFLSVVLCLHNNVFFSTTQWPAPSALYDAPPQNFKLKR